MSLRHIHHIPHGENPQGCRGRGAMRQFQLRTNLARSQIAFLSVQLVANLATSEIVPLSLTFMAARKANHLIGSNLAPVYVGSHSRQYKMARRQCFSPPGRLPSWQKINHKHTTSKKYAYGLWNGCNVAPGLYNSTRIRPTYRPTGNQSHQYLISRFHRTSVFGCRAAR